MINFYGQR